MKLKCPVTPHSIIIIDGFKEWKKHTFLQIAEGMDQNTVTNIIAIGDNQIEIDAAN